VEELILLCEHFLFGSFWPSRN